MPSQTRSRNSHERILAAIEALLAKREFSTITVEDIASTAHVSVGTFYKHFAAKREVLPDLTERLQAQGAHRGFAGRPPQLPDASLSARVRHLVRTVVSESTIRRNLARACVAARYTNELMLPQPQAERIREQMRSVHDWLLECRGEIRHDNPALAVRIGFYAALHSLQTVLLFEDLPADLPVETMASETERLLMSYWTCPKSGEKNHGDS